MISCFVSSETVLLMNFLGSNPGTLLSPDTAGIDSYMDLLVSFIDISPFVI